MNFLDLAGLASAPSEAYIAALGLEDTIPIQPANRLTFLKRLREGAGVHVYTGPRGAGFWLPASIEVHVNVVPDDYELREREQPGLSWALQAVGVSPILARGLAQRYEDKEPTKALRLYDKWLEAKELLARYEQTTGETIIVEASHIEAVTDPAEQLALLDRLEDVALDWEWDIETLYPEGLSAATADRTWYLPVVALDYEAPRGHGQRLREKVADVVKRTRTIWHNAKADLGTQWIGDPLDAFGAHLDDTLVMAFVAGEHDLALKPLGRGLLGRDPLDYPGPMRDLLLATGTRYGGADARNTFDLATRLTGRLAEREQTKIYTDIERPIVPLLTSMERYGHPISPARTQELLDNFSGMEEGLRSRFWAEEHLDLAKDKDTRELVRRRAGYDPGTCKKEALAKIPGDWMDNVLAYRQLRHQRRAFLAKHLDRWRAEGSPEDFRIYTQFNQAGAADAHDMRSFKKAPRSGRLSSSGGVNLQNQPTSIRSIFTAPPGCVTWALDYNQLEIRIAAARSGDPGMIAAALSGDFHGVFQRKIHEFSGQMIEKVAAKQGNFNANYGGYIDMLRTILQKQRVFLDDETLLLIVDAHKKAYPGWYTYGEDVVRFAQMTGYSETAYGRRRYDDDIRSADNRTALGAQRALINHTIQGTAADMLKIAMRLCVPVLQKYGAHLAIQAHDELEGWVPVEAAEAFMAGMKVVLSSLTLPGMTFSVSGTYGATWDEAKE